MCGRPLSRGAGATFTDMSDDVVIPFPGPRAPVDDTPLLREALGEVFRQERLDQGRTLQDVADDAFVSVGHLSEVERGLKEGSSEVIDAIGRSLGLELADVLERTADRLRAGMCSAGVRRASQHRPVTPLAVAA